MKGSGLIIRLIDIVLILLLGFLNISDIIHKNEIKLPTGKKSSSSSTKSEILRLRIHIVPSDTLIDSLHVANTDENITYKDRSQEKLYYQIDEGDKSYRIRNLVKLEDQILRVRNRYDSVLVIINPDSNSIIQGTINLIDICRLYGLKRMFDYKYQSQ